MKRGPLSGVLQMDPQVQGMGLSPKELREMFYPPQRSHPPKDASGVNVPRGHWPQPEPLCGSGSNSQQEAMGSKALEGGSFLRWTPTALPMRCGFNFLSRFHFLCRSQPFQPCLHAESSPRSLKGG